MKLSHLSFTILVTLFVMSIQTIRLEDLKHKSKSELLHDALIQVTQSSANCNYNLNKQMFVIKVEEREKRFAYTKINQFYQKAITILKKAKMIVDQDFFPKSKIKTTYLPKRRRWLFTLTFVIGGNLLELSRSYRSLSKLGVQKLKNFSIVKFSSQKIKILDAYNNAREALRRALKVYSDIEIKQVETVQIIGLRSQNERTLDAVSQLVSNGYEQVSSGQCAWLAEVQGKQAQQNQIRMKVLFRIGQTDSQEFTYSTDQTESSSSSGDSYSDYSEQ